MKNIKRLGLTGLISVLLVGTIACSDSATAPTPTTTAASTTPAVPTAGSTSTTPAPTTPGPTTPVPAVPTPAAPAGNVTVTRNPANYSCNPNTAITPQVVSWTITVTNNPTPMDLTSLVFHSDKAGCDPTIENPRTDMFGVKGPTSYGAGVSGQTTFTFNTVQYTCGRDQPDVRDLIGEVINHGKDCPPPPPAPPARSLLTVGAACVTAVGSFTTNITISGLTNVAKVVVSGPTALTFTANGTQNVRWPVGTYNWTATATAGAVFDNGQVTTTGIVTVVDCSTPPPPPPPPPVLACTPLTQTININQTASVSAKGGTGNYVWTAPGSLTPTGTGPTFATSYSIAGTDTITVQSGTQTATCQVIVPPPAAVCSAALFSGITKPVAVTPASGSPYATVTFTLSAKTMIYEDSYSIPSGDYPQYVFDEESVVLQPGLQTLKFPIPASGDWQYDAACHPLPSVVTGPNDIGDVLWALVASGNYYITPAEGIMKALSFRR